MNEQVWGCLNQKPLFIQSTLTDHIFFFKIFLALDYLYDSLCHLDLFQSHIFNTFTALCNLGLWSIGEEKKSGLAHHIPNVWATLGEQAE